MKIKLGKDPLSIGSIARETMSKIDAERDALKILRERHYLEYQAIYKKQLEMRRKAWEK